MIVGNSSNVNRSIVEKNTDDDENVKYNLEYKETEVELVENVRTGKTTTEFYNNKVKDFEGEARKNTKLGKIGEQIVVDYEKIMLMRAGREDLADRVRMTSDFAGNAEKFDVLSFDENGNEKYIEVKTTRGGLSNLFHISESEVAFSWQFADKYYLYRVYNLNPKTKSASLKILKGAITREKLTATEYTCRMGEKS